MTDTDFIVMQTPHEKTTTLISTVSKLAVFRQYTFHYTLYNKHYLMKNCFVVESNLFKIIIS